MSSAPRFLNADLEIESYQPLDLIIHELTPSFVLLFHGSFKDNRQMASFEVTFESKNPEEKIAAFCSQLEGMSEKATNVWRESFSRRIDLGFESSSLGEPLLTLISPPLLERLSKLNCELRITIYPKPC